MPDMLKKEEPLFAWVGNQPDAKEGVMSFIERRDPEWSMNISELPEIKA